MRDTLVLNKEHHGLTMNSKMSIGGSLPFPPEAANSWRQHYKNFFSSPSNPSFATFGRNHLSDWHLANIHLANKTFGERDVWPTLSFGQQLQSINGIQLELNWPKTIWPTDIWLMRRDLAGRHLVTKMSFRRQTFGCQDVIWPTDIKSVIWLAGIAFGCHLLSF